ncbi:MULTISPECIES: o-succinylbenzoate--CoA ligase [unclassified Amycolatopsis]|uniref:o-succinylbenzoate--CoA ligase n=1 Tax=unclassified Amycolatopsis TaxID=2618356 RepID=UPI0028767D33|nr:MULTISPECIES: o-succinylbenzoate--CoA ligase [unclassified Amycolatopsis]MDS0132565.1 AMP-binding protein [Amycolatopsis sp. 505]MDS0142610.1 AMP-binding protein [Amycolatopsis sp. CM201R]
MLPVHLDGSPEALETLKRAVADALGGGPAVLPFTDPALRDAMAPDEPAEPGTAVVIATSGSTGAPKGVLLSARALTASAGATHTRLGGPGHWLLATPAHYIGGLQVLVRSLLAGTTPALLTGAGFRPDDFAAAAARLGDGPRYTALVPTQLVRLLDDGGAGLAAARTFDAIVVGAAATPPSLRERAEDARVRIVPAYGMSETASGCVYDGVPLDGVRVDVEGDRIRIAGNVLAHGYRRRPDLTAESFSDGWFTTSDRGVRHADGRVEVLGRADDMINTGGVKVSANAIERCLRAQPGVRDACVVGVPDPEWGEAVVALVVPPGAHGDLRAAVRAELGAAATPKRIESASELPLRGPGKVDRAAVKARLQPRPTG